MGAIMSKMKLEKVDGKHACSWCFARDETVLRDAQSDTYWHQDCFDAAGDVIHQMRDWLYFQKSS